MVQTSLEKVQIQSISKNSKIQKVKVFQNKSSKYFYIKKSYCLIEKFKVFFFKWARVSQDCCISHHSHNSWLKAEILFSSITVSFIYLACDYFFALCTNFFVFNWHFNFLYQNFYHQKKCFMSPVIWLGILFSLTANLYFFKKNWG